MPSFPTEEIAQPMPEPEMNFWRKS
jgi:hypothetical protein